MYDKELLRKFARYEIGAREIPAEYFPESEEDVYRLETVYQITVDDLMAVVSRLEHEDIRYVDFMDEWYGPLEYGFVLGKLLGLKDDNDLYDDNSNEPARDPAEALPDDDFDVVEEILDDMGTPSDDVWYDDDHDYDEIYRNGEEIEHDEDEGTIGEHEAGEPEYALARDVIDIGYIRELVSCYEANKSRPVSEWDFPEFIKMSYIQEQAEAIHAGKEPDEEYKALFRRYTEELTDKGDDDALEILGYQYYGGTSVYPCDWVKAKEIFTDLFKRTGKPIYANTLGYIYYYGRTTDGVPDYDKAYYYFSFGAAAGYYESRYKIADMISKGRAVPMNKGLAAGIIEDMYQENRRVFEAEIYDCKFADIALRMGGVFEEGAEFYGKDPAKALGYYLQAKLAIRLRKEYNYYGDSSVERNIDEAIDRVAKNVAIQIDSGKANVDILELTDDYDTDNFYVKFDDDKDGAEITLRRENGYKYLVTIPEEMYSELLPEITVRFDGETAKGESAFIIEPEFDHEYLITDFGYNFDSESIEFYSGNDKVCEVRSKGWMFDLSERSGDSNTRCTV